METASGKSLLIAPASEYYLNNKDFTARRFFLFTISGNNISEGRIVEFIGKSFNVEENIDALLINYDQDVITDFNGGIFQYDVNYNNITNKTYNNGTLSKQNASIINGNKNFHCCPVKFPMFLQNMLGFT
ncbi:hypothetical protein GCM10023231_06890 [Olivibacter ginsenosidimutans]|uniref:Uncharacterized protein n=1 Tax=Olivibacter ginsenosidimutans TaxID=1176537 RepID=A0ABP9AJD6_9SPHI